MAFEGIIGHAPQKAVLSSMLEKDKVPHALLFVGPEGIGKKRLALEFAKLMLCEGRNACGSCLSCRMATKGSHPDLLVLGEEEGAVGIETSRLLRSEGRRPPFQAKRRVLLLDHAESMTEEASNALLKTLEEPPPYVVFLLVTAEERSMRPTLRSRCLRIVFNPLRREEVQRFLMEKQGLREEETQTVCSISLGSIGLGLFWLERENLLLRKRLSEVLMEKEGGNLEVTALSETISQDRRRAWVFLSFLLSLFRDLYMLNHDVDPSFAINRDLLPPRKRYDDATIISAIRITSEALLLLSHNVNRWALLEQLFQRLRGLL